MDNGWYSKEFEKLLKIFFTAYSLDKSVQSFKHCSKSESNSIFDDVVTSNQKISKQVQVQRSRKSCWKIVWKKKYYQTVTLKLCLFWFQCAGSADFVYVSVCLSNVNRHLFFKNDSKFEKNGNQNTLAHTFYVPLYWISYLQSDNSYSYACIRPKVTLANRMKNAKIGIVTGCVNMRRNYSADRFWKIKSTSSMQDCRCRVQATDKMEGCPTWKMNFNVRKPTMY